MLVANGVEAMISERNEYTPTPAVSLAILNYNKDRKISLADGIVITPSHNPPHDGGLKYNPSQGGASGIAITIFSAKQLQKVSTTQHRKLQKPSKLKVLAY